MHLLHDIFPSLVFAGALYLTGITLNNLVAYTVNKTGDKVTVEVILTSLAWGLYHYLTH